MLIKEILSERNKNHMADNNKNGLIDPWEFQNPTIFSGDIKESEKELKGVSCGLQQEEDYWNFCRKM